MESEFKSRYIFDVIKSSNSTQIHFVSNCLSRRNNELNSLIDPGMFGF